MLTQEKTVEKQTQTKNQIDSNEVKKRP